MNAIINCLATSHDFGRDVVYNVCDKTQTVVPWGTMTWGKEAITLVFLAGIIYFVTQTVLNIKDVVKVEVTNKKKKTV